ncbi:lipase family protein [Mycolicibacterium sp. 050232]|uniref:lipase family protein n=1 Tax=Mycolicibacterium sp. 050232 TaxID=3113982 RepID=UPI002E2AEB32|nr:lipase family protein [Mycolicibacterium sp. 050232]MED5814338.1 lipase family protein [Mycolicibacterium sp. 050232]
MRLGIALISTTVLVLAGCGSHTETDAEKSDSGAEPSHNLSSVPLTNVDDSVREAASSMNIVTHISRSGINDWESHPNTSVFVPKGDAPDGGFPIVALGHQITGSTQECPLSQSPTLLGLAPTVVALLNAGYVVTVPDFQGLAKPPAGGNESDTYHPYLDSMTSGYNMIDAAQAAHVAEPQTSTSWLAMGVGEGGQAAWAANEMAVDYNNFEGDFVGSVSISPISGVNGLADAAQNGTLTDDQKVVLARFLAALHTEDPDVVNLDDFRRGAAQQHWDALMGCQSASAARQVAAQIPPDDLKPANAEAVDTLRGYLRKVNLPQGPTTAPMLVNYSDADAISLPVWTDRALDEACRMGDTITIRKDPQFQTDSPATLSWIADRFASKPAQNDCEGRN